MRALKDLYLTVLSDQHEIRHGFHPEIVKAHNRLTEEVLKLRERVRELERNSTEPKTD